MAGIILVILLVLGILAILPISILACVQGGRRDNELYFKALSERIQKLEKALRKTEEPPEKPAVAMQAAAPEKPVLEKEPSPSPKTDAATSVTKPSTEKTGMEKALEKVKEEKARTSPLPPPAAQAAGMEEKRQPSEKRAESATKTIAPISQPPPPPREESEFEKNAAKALKKIWEWIVVGEDFRKEGVSAEYAVATTWLLRSSILILLVGIGFFLRWSIENNYIGPAHRVALCVLAGSGLVAWGMRLCAGKYRPIAQGLTGCGFATLYFSMFAAFNLYHLMGQPPAFALMTLITAVAALVALRTDSLLTAIIAVVGGYFTPVMLSTGQANLPGLFAYVLLLSVGMLSMAHRKDWKLLNFLSLVFAWFLVAAAAGRHYQAGQDLPAFLAFTSCFFVIFSIAPIAYNLRNRIPATALELFLLFANTTAFFVIANEVMLNKESLSSKCGGALALGIAAFYVALLWLMLRKKNQDRKLFFIFVGFAGFFITLSVPMILSGRWITFSWSLQALVFLWLAEKIRSKALRNIAFLVYLAAFLRILFHDMGQFFLVRASCESYLSMMGARLCSMGSFAASLLGAWWLARRNPEFFRDEGTRKDGEGQNLVMVLIAAGSVALFAYLHFEFFQLAKSYYPPIAPALITSIWLAAIILLSRLHAKTGSMAARNLLVAVGALLLGKIILFDVLGEWKADLRLLRFQGTHSAEMAIVRLLDFLPVTLAMFLTAKAFGKRLETDAKRFFAAMGIAVLLCWLTFETGAFLDCHLPKFRPGGISLLWGVFALASVVLGIKKNSKHLRYFGLALFTVTVFKVFLSDIATLSQIYRIVAFLALGVTVLAASFAYVRFKEYFNTGMPPGNDKEN